MRRVSTPVSGSYGSTTALLRQIFWHLQFAFEGQWETTLLVTRDRACAAELGAWLSSASGDLAVEAFYSVAHHSAFIGVRLAALANGHQQEVAFQLVAAFVAGEVETSDAFVKQRIL